ncbi:MAG: hypothetical protein K8S23_06505 [Candidatus Cloacimonetes bacterium]|nr:hypothetical protein [Candidatus Cloacimonadota bacterium]
MRINVRSIVIILSIIMMWGCATSYKPINPESIYLNSKQKGENLDFDYSYDVLQKSGNKKYSKKEN